MQAAGRHESLTSVNMEKKARWKEELQREKEAALALSEKAQWWKTSLRTNALFSPNIWANIGPFLSVYNTT